MCWEEVAVLENKLITLGAVVIGSAIVAALVKYCPDQPWTITTVATIGMAITGALKGLLSPSSPAPQPPTTKDGQ